MGAGSGGIEVDVVFDGVNLDGGLDGGGEGAPGTLAGGTETTDGPGAKLLETGVGEGRVEVDAVKHGVDLDGGLDGGGEGALGTLAGGTETTDGPGAKLLETGVGDRTAKVACQRGRRVARARRRYGDDRRPRSKAPRNGRG